MNVRFALPEEIERWDELLTQNPDGGNVFQSVEIAATKQARGWTPRYIMLDDAPLTIHERTVPLLGKMWYAIKGPGWITEASVRERVIALTPFARKHGVFCIKIEPELPKSAALEVAFTQNGYKKVRPIQPNFSTIILDLSPSLDDIMASLNQKGRHAIRRAERDGVEAGVVDFTEENARKMYALFAETAEGRFRIRPFEYHYAFWKSFADKNTGALFFAHHEGRLVAAAFAMYMGSKGTYKDGASTRERTAYGASHLLQWRVIEWMKSHGVTTHDLCGAPPADRINDPTHPHYGIGRFKTSFNKEVTEYIGAYDVPVSPLAYTFWAHIGERATLALHSKLRGEYWY